jgi:hypothetical protein
MGRRVGAADAAELVTATGRVGLLPLTRSCAAADIPTLECAAAAARDRITGPDAGELVSLLAVFMAHFHADVAARELVRRAKCGT